MLGDEEPLLVRKDLEVGEVTVFVEDAGQFLDLLLEGLTHEPVAGGVDAALASALEQALDELGVVVRRVAEQFVGEVAVGAGEQGVGRGGQVVAVLRSTGALADLAVGDEAVGRERHQVLADATRRQLELVGQVVGGELAALLQRFLE